MEISSNMLEKTEKDPGRPERPFPLRPGSWFEKGFAAFEDDGYPVKDENDLIFMDSDIYFMAGISRYFMAIPLGHAAFEVEVASEIADAEVAFRIIDAQSAQMEGDSYGR